MEQSDLDSYCLQYSVPKNIGRTEQQTKAADDKSSDWWAKGHLKGTWVYAADTKSRQHFQKKEIVVIVITVKHV